MNTLFGINLAAIAVGLVKLFVDVFGLKQRAAEEVRAILLTLAAAAIGLQQMGAILPPESEQYVVFALSIVSTYLVVRGFLPEASSLVRALTDTVKVRALTGSISVWLQANETATEDSVAARVRRQSRAVELARRYRV